MSSTNYYHLNFELYPSPNPAATTTDIGRHSLQTDALIWRPAREASIFDSLPEHRNLSLETPAADGCLFSSAVATPGVRGKASRDESYKGSDNLSHFAGRKPAAAGVTECVSRISSQDGSTTWTSTDQSLQPRAETTKREPFAADRDWRFGQVHIESFDMEEASENDKRPTPGTNHHQQQQEATPAASLGPVLGGAGQSTRARYISLEPKTTNAGWGIVHLYRETGGKEAYNVREAGDDASEGSDGTILCIPAVPSYLTPNDFLGFVGETWNQGVSHYRMILTSRSNRYMVLIKFRDADRAREWRNAFDGRIFNSMEAEVCHVTFIKTITITAPGDRPHSLGEKDGRSSSNTKKNNLLPSASISSPSPHVSSSLRPFPPPTPNLIELPTCPVCLERMDDTSGLMTILCQHVFHCTCLQTWKGSGCPVCRATNPSPLAAASSSTSSSFANNNGSGSMAGPSGTGSQHGPAARPFGSGVSNLCSVCDCTDDLWICLICGYVGCGRYKRGHAKEHWKETGHSFSLELETQHVWDYAKDMWVHRLLRDKGDGKVVELPRRQSEHDGRRKKNRSGGGGSGGSSSGQAGPGGQQQEDDENDDDEDEDVVPRAKVEHLGVEYSHLLISQLESQRVYFEEMVSKAADKAAKAAAAAEAATARASEVLEEMGVLREENKRLAEATVPGLERDSERERRRADKASELARNLGRSLQEEKKVSEGLMARISHMQEQMTEVQEQLKVAQAENAEMREMNRDLSMFISGQEKLRELQAEGQVDSAEVEAGTVSLPEGKRPGGGKGKGRKR